MKSEPTASVMRKSERLEKQSTPSPRRSERGKNQSSSGSSGSKKKKVDRNSRSYIERFKKKARKLDVLDNPSTNIYTSKKSCDTVRDLRPVSIGKDSEKTSSNSSLGKHPNELSENDNGKESSYTGQNIRSAGACQSEDEDSVKVTEVGGSPLLTADKAMPRKLDLDSEAEKKILNSEIVSLELNERSTDGDVGLKSSYKDKSLKRKRDEHSVIAVKEVNGPDVAGKFSGKPFINLQPEDFPEDIQQDGDQNTCLTCKLGGKLLCCEGKGCKRSYHISCLDPPLKDIPLEVWYCLACVEKKIKLGEHSVSEGIESIWKVETSEENGSQKRHFFVKYKGLSHIHNRWVSETLLQLQAPSLLTKFNRKNQVSTWKDEWTEPHRMLQKRLLGSLKQFNEVSGGRAGDIVLWLVKWRGLDYENATWESENASFMKLPKTQSLISDYENRLERAKKTIHKNEKQEIQIERGSVKAMMSAGCPTEIDNINLEFINSLREQWLRGRNVIIIDDLDRIMKVITFIASLVSDGCWPFMIITGSAGSWDEDLFRLAPSLAAVVYQGNKDTRRKIRALEFYAEAGGLTFDVLITSPEVVVEDLDVLQTLKWEAVIVDDCQRSRMYSHFEHLKSLRAEMRLLLANGQVKDGIIEHLLPLLDCHEDVSGNEGLILNSDHRMRYMKEILSKYIIDSSKTDTSRFIEYWVPVLISNPQLEQYCATLHANSLQLCLSSNSKHDPVGAFREIVISNRKCCDHPYIMDSLLATHLTKDLQPSDFLDVGIKASGKLQLLDAMLLEIRNRGLRVLVLFQSSGGCPKDNIGDILDDFVRQRFGKDSYERLEVLVNPGRKQTALNTFNNEKSRFVFLLETRACSSRIKLSSIDTVIIFSSDWNPANDFRNLQKITLDTQSQQLKIFRLYSSFTVEENALILAKHGKPLDSNLRSMSRATGHNMLMWGVSHLFCKLEEFHGFPTVPTCGSTSLGPVSHEDIIRDFLNILTQNVKDYTARNSTILKARQHQGNYNTAFPLPGEQKIQESDADLPHMFWKKLLDGKQPQWKYTSGLSQTNRKRAQHRDEALEQPEGETEEVVKKRKKVTNNNSGQTSVRPAAAENDGSFGAASHNVCQEMNSGSNTHQNASDAKITSSLPSVARNEPELLAVNIKFGENTDMADSQKSLHAQLKPEIVKVCEILQLPEEVKIMAKSFLEYVVNNCYVIKEPVTILQAFHISLCWTAASMSKYKVDHKESFELAKKHLNFECRREEADYVYSMLRCLKKVFIYHRKNSNLAYTAASSGTLSSDNKVRADKSSLLKPTILQQEKIKFEDLSVDGQVLSQLAQHGFQKSIKDIEKRFAKQMKKLLEKQHEEIVECQTNYDNEKAQLENKKKTEAAVIRCYSRSSLRVDKLKQLDIEYNEKFEELKQRMEMDLENLKETHRVAKEKVEKQKDDWLQGLTSWAKRSFIANTGNAPSNSMENMREREIPGEVQETASTHDDDVVITEVRCTGKQNPDCTGHSLEGPITSSMMPNRDPSVEVCENANTTISKNIGAPETSLAQATAGTTMPKENSSNADDNVQQNQQDEASPVIAAGSGAVNSASNEVSGQKINQELEKVAEAIFNDDSNAPDKSTSVTQEREDIPSGNPEIPVGAEVCETREPPDLEAPSVIADSGNVVMLNENHDQDKFDEQVGMDRSVAAEISDSSERVTAPTQQNEDSPPALPESVSQVQGKDTTDKQDGEVQAIEKVGDKQSQPLDKSDGESVRGVTGSSPDQVADNIRSRDENDRVRDIGSTLPVRQSQDDDILTSQNLQTDRGLVDGVSSVANEDDHAHVPSLASQEQHIQQTAPTTSLDRFPSTEQANTASVQTNSNFSPNAIDVPFVGGLEGNINNAGCSRQMAEHSNQATRNVPFFSGLNTYSAQVPTLAMSRDPLQNELERIRKEREQIAKHHDDTKLQLKADCEREIQEIRRKYEIKYQEEESEFLSRKKELDTNHNKVLMNKVLAEAFRSKCMDLKGSGAPSLQQDVPSSFLQQLLQLLTNGQRNISGAGPPSATQRPNASVQPSAPMAPSMRPLQQPSTPMAPSTRPLQQPSTPTAPSLRRLHQSSATRPLHQPSAAGFAARTAGPHMARSPLVINSISPSAGTAPSVTDIRTPPPHLQFRPPPPPPPPSTPVVGLQETAQTTPFQTQLQAQPQSHPANIPPQSEAVPASSPAGLANRVALPEDNSRTQNLASPDALVCLSDDD